MRYEHLSVGELITDLNVGVAPLDVQAEEFGTHMVHLTKLTINTKLPAIAGGANLAIGKKIYTFPAGNIVVEAARMALSIQQTEGNITADTPDGGLGTTIASGAVATLDGTPAFENILTGQTFDDCDGTVEDALVANQVLAIAAGGGHDVHFNVADLWAAGGDAGAILAGTVWLRWSFLGG